MGKASGESMQHIGAEPVHAAQRFQDLMLLVLGAFAPQNQEQGPVDDAKANITVAKT